VARRLTRGGDAVEADEGVEAGGRAGQNPREAEGHEPAGAQALQQRFGTAERTGRGDNDAYTVYPIIYTVYRKSSNSGLYSIKGRSLIMAGGGVVNTDK